MLAGAPWGEEGSGGWEGCKGGSGAAHEQQLHRRRFEFEFRIQTGCTWRTRGSGGHVGSEADGARSRLARDTDARVVLGRPRARLINQKRLNKVNQTKLRRRKVDFSNGKDPPNSFLGAPETVLVPTS